MELAIEAKILDSVHSTHNGAKKDVIKSFCKRLCLFEPNNQACAKINRYCSILQVCCQFHDACAQHCTTGFYVIEVRVGQFHCLKDVYLSWVKVILNQTQCCEVIFSITNHWFVVLKNFGSGTMKKAWTSVYFLIMCLFVLVCLYGPYVL